jgi:CubicO group peptidase (beta-lactamase class C family)
LKSSTPDITQEFIKKVEELMSQEMARLNVPGSSIAIVKNDKIVYSQGFGTRNIKQRLVSDANTLYNIASITKSFICLALLILEEEGKLDLHDPISKYIPCSLGYKDDPITLHHLMTHSSGIPEIIGGLNDLERSIDIPSIPLTSWDDFFRHISSANEYISEKPGKRFYYQNSGYAILGRIIEVVSGQNLNQFIMENILSPLQMKQSTFLREELEKLDNVSLAYKVSDKEKKFVPTAYDNIDSRFGYAPGGLFSSVSELANYMILFLNRGKFQEIQLVRSDKIDLMQTMHFQETSNSKVYTPMIGNFGVGGYGYGFAIHEDFYGYKLVHHSGSRIGASAWIAMLPELKFGVIILSNKHPSHRLLALVTLGLLLGIDPVREFPFFRYRNHLEKLTGEYELFKGVSKMKIISNGGVLYYHHEYWVSNLPLFPIESSKNHLITLNYYLITDVGEKEPIQFEIDKDGTIWMHHDNLKWKKVKNQ